MMIDIFAFSALTLLVGRQEKYHTHTRLTALCLGLPG